MALLGSSSSRLHTSMKDSDSRIDLSPMIDCVFILLIFFVVTTVFVEESGIQANRPSLDDSIPEDPDDSVRRLEFLVTSDGLVKFRNRTIPVEVVASLVAREIQRNATVPVLISAEDGAKHDMFARVYGSAKAGGASRISFK